MTTYDSLGIVRFAETDEINDVPGETLADRLNQIASTASAAIAAALPAGAGIRVLAGSPQSIADSAATPIAFTADPLLIDGVTAAGTTGIEIGTTGLYALAAHVQWAGHAGGIRQLAFAKNGVVQGSPDFSMQRLTPADADPFVNAIADDAILNAGDIISIVAYQNTGGDLDVQGARLALHRLGPAS